MAGSGSVAPIAVVCDDRTDARTTVARLLERCGFVVGGTADSFLSLRTLVRELQPTVAVVTLPLPGMNGLRAVRELREDAPSCQIVLLSEFGQLDVAAVEAGAAALVPEQDLPALQLVLRGLADTAPRLDLSLPGPRVQAVEPAVNDGPTASVA